MNNTFLKLAKIGLVMIYLVIIAGSVVRMTGSGMGCPDWPKCFGMWIPPTDVSQLPLDYQQTYADRGYADTSFNVFHTWTEYLNRLVGALTGFIILAMLLFSFGYWRSDRRVVWLCLLAVIAIGFQAWLGKLVVDSVLTPVKITVHMLMALVMVALQLYIIKRTSSNSSKITTAVGSSLRWIAIGCLFLTLVQVTLGTQVREQVDEIAAKYSYGNRWQWISELNAIFKLHRSFSLVVIMLNSYLVWALYNKGIRWQANGWLILLLAIEILTGIVLTYLGMPAYIQPVHLLLASLIFGTQFWILLKAFHNQPAKVIGN
ncbi:MAG: COX15/CtaA family protein [Chitinophagales bacterium]|nr:COX15/CtaA family protein [Chitinophagales bacterium]